MDKVSLPPPSTIFDCRQTYCEIQASIFVTKLGHVATHFQGPRGAMDNFHINQTVKWKIILSPVTSGVVPSEI